MLGVEKFSLVDLNPGCLSEPSGELQKILMSPLVPEVGLDRGIRKKTPFKMLLFRQVQETLGWAREHSVDCE